MSGCVNGHIAFDPDVLDEFKKGLSAVVTELNAVGSEGTADTGLALENLALSSATLGRSDVADALSEVVERGRWLLHGGLEAVEDANNKLTDTRDLYTKADQAAHQLFDRLYADLNGDPTARTGGDGAS
jgi:hypothetical protein